MSEAKRRDFLSGILDWCLMVLLGFGLLAVVVPAFIKARSTSAVNACVNNLRQIDTAANQFALENGLSTGTPIRYPNDLTPYLKVGHGFWIPQCPDGGWYSVARVGDTPTCSLGSTVVPKHVLP